MAAPTLLALAFFGSTALLALRPHGDLGAQASPPPDDRATDQEQQFTTYIDDGRLDMAAAFLMCVDSLHLVPREQADVWIVPPGQPASDTVRPVPGKVNLICTVGEATDEPGHAYSAAVLTAFIRHWVTKYGAHNLAVTMVWPGTTRIRFHHPPWDNATLQFASPAAAAGWYLQDYLHLAVAVAIQAPHPQAVMAPDGRPMTVNRLQFNAFWAHDPELVRRT